MRDTILTILKRENSMKVIELTLAVWAQREGINLKERGVWSPTEEEKQEITKVDRAVCLLLLKLEEEGIVEISQEPEWLKWVRLRKVKV